MVWLLKTWRRIRCGLGWHHWAYPFFYRGPCYKASGYYCADCDAEKLESEQCR